MNGQQQPSNTPATLTQRLDINFALQTAGLGLWELDPVTKQLLWDDRCRQLFGLANDNPLTYEQAIQYIYPDDLVRVDLAVQQVLSGQSNGQYDVTYRTVGADDGLLRWVRFIGRAELTPDGQVYRFAGVAQEVTEQRQAQQALQENQQFLQAVIDLAELGSYTIDVTSFQMVKSARVAQWYGLSEQTDVESSMKAILESDRERVGQVLAQALEPGAPGSYQVEYTIHNLQTGVRHSLRTIGQVRRNEDGQPFCVEGAVMDITPQRELQLMLEQQVQARTQELAASEARYRELAQSLEAQVHQRT
ncbi:PAS domain-containing protein [Spirosoma jeollabukense]